MTSRNPACERSPRREVERRANGRTLVDELAKLFDQLAGREAAVAPVTLKRAIDKCAPQCAALASLIKKCSGYLPVLLRVLQLMGPKVSTLEDVILFLNSVYYCMQCGGDFTIG